VPLLLRWQHGASERAFPLRDRPLGLVLDGEALDRVREIPEGADGLQVSPPDAEGRVALEARGGLRFQARGREARRVRLRPGGGVELRRAGEAAGRLLLEGEAPDPRDPLLGRELGGYRILGRLGSGAVGVVYRALQLSLDREVALKVLHPEAARDPRMVASFNREAVAAGRLSHPNLVQVHDVGEEDGWFFYSMELLSEGSLEDRLRQGPLPWREAVAAVRDTAEALAYAEEHRLVHRDVKPENLMIAASGHVKLSDLGLAATRGLVDREAAGGTPHFMAPEAIGGREVDSRADLYSLGCTLYRLLTGDTVFHGETVRDILRAHRDEEPPSLKEAGVEAPPGLEELLARLLAKDPARRPASAREVVEACEALLRGERRRGPLLALAALLLLAAGAAAWRLTRPVAAPPHDEVRTVVQTDPETERQNEELRVQLALEKARNLEDPEQRIAALEAFAETFAGRPEAEAARAEAESLRREREEAEARAEAARREAEAARARLEEAVRSALEAERPAEALDALADPSDPALASRLQEEIGAWLEDRAAAFRRTHEAALEAGDWEGAAALRAGFQDLLEPAEHPLLASLAAELGALEKEAAERRRAGRRAAFDAARAAFVQALQEQVEPALLRLDGASAHEAFRNAAASLGHEALRREAEARLPLFEAAAAAAARLRERLASGEEIAVVEPRAGKRARLLAIRDEGLHIEVQVQGERVERTDAWDLWLEPGALGGLLRAVLPGGDPPEPALALYLLAGEARLARELRAWAARGAPAGEAAALAERLRAWPAAPPRRFEGSTPPSWWAAAREDLQALAEALDAVAAEDAYLATLRFEEFLGRFRLLGAWISDGRSTWGLEP